MVYVQDKDGNPLMPTRRHGWVHRALRDGRAVVVQRCPFTIRLTYESGAVVQPVKLGLKPGYDGMGVSAVAAHAELFSAEIAWLDGISQRLEDRSMYRRNRRGRLRYRKPRPERDRKPTGWLPPSIRHKADSHVRVVEQVKAILPISRIVVEVAAFDLHKLKNPEVSGTGYQQGEQYGFDNVREYVLHRDGHRCRNPACPDETAPRPILQVHHVGYWKGDRTDRPGNLITLCTRCHTPANHQPGGCLYGWEPKQAALKAATFMGILRKQLMERLDAEATYGYLTKARRREQGLDKTRANEAFVIAGGQSQTRARLHIGVQRRRNNRSLEKFHDARYRDLRDGKVRSGKELSSSRRTRSRENLSPSNRQYRGHKVKAGYRAIRTRRYLYQPGDLVRVNGQLLTVKGTHCKGARVMLSNGRSVAVGKLVLVKYGRGINYQLQPGGRDSSPASHSVGGGILAVV